MPRDKKHQGSLIYGPVPSRRLGRSLGVDAVAYKTCTYDCIYCQIGRTPKTTIERRPWIDPGRVIKELETTLCRGVQPDFITIGGSGEPCLNSGIGAIIKGIKQISDIPVAVITNGSLLWIRQVREDIKGADVVLPSLDAYDQNTFSRINRPHPQISFERMLKGLSEFRKEYCGLIWLEIFVLEGINDSQEAMKAFRSHIDRICPDRVDLNTAVRPPAEKQAAYVTEERLSGLARILGNRAGVIAEFRKTRQNGAENHDDSEILDMLSRRPCTVKDIAAGLGLDETCTAEKVNRLLNSGRIETKKSGENTYYFKIT